MYDGAGAQDSKNLTCTVVLYHCLLLNSKYMSFYIKHTTRVFFIKVLFVEWLIRSLMALLKQILMVLLIPLVALEVRRDV